MFTMSARHALLAKPAAKTYLTANTRRTQGSTMKSDTTSSNRKRPVHAAADARQRRLRSKREAQCRYRQSPKGRECQWRYKQSLKRRECQRRYDLSPKGRECQRRYNLSPKGRERNWRSRRSDGPANQPERSSMNSREGIRVSTCNVR